MILLKLLGGGLVILSCAVWTADRKTKMKEHLNSLDTAVRFITHVRREIDCFATPIPKIFASFSDENADKYGFTAAICADPPYVPGDLPLTEEERAELLAFITTVGGGFAEGELKLCDMYIEKFSDCAERAREEYPRKAKVQGSLAFLAGAGCVILLI